MRKSLLAFGAATMVALVALASLMLMALNSHGQTVPEPTSKQQDSLKRYLQHYVGDPNSGDNRATRYSSASVDLQDNGTDEAIVYLSGDGWCGSGGCMMLVLAPQTSSYRVVARFTITWPPIRVLETKSHGWHGIAVWMQGGGIEPGYEAEFSFNGKTYVSDDKTSLRPSKRLRERVLPGKVVISSAAFERAERLYP